MLLILVNIGILLALLSQKKSRKAPLMVGLVYGGIKAALYVVFGLAVAMQMEAPPTFIVLTIVVALIRGAIGFLSAWALLYLLKRIDDIEIAARLAPKGVITKPKSVVLEWIGVMVTGVVCAFS